MPRGAAIKLQELVNRWPFRAPQARARLVLISHIIFFFNTDPLKLSSLSGRARRLSHPLLSHRVSAGRRRDTGCVGQRGQPRGRGTGARGARVRAARGAPKRAAPARGGSSASLAEQGAPRINTFADGMLA